MAGVGYEIENKKHTTDMKKILLILMACLIAAGGAEAQQKGQRKGKKGDSPAIEGKQKVRESDYMTFDRFTQFTTKDLNRYFTPFDYSKICAETQEKVPNWGTLQPVMNYLEKVSRATLTMCAVYAVNPSVEGSKEHDRIAAQGRQEALKAVECFDAWKVEQGWRNKIQYKVAEVDYRYFKGAAYGDGMYTDELIHVGVILYFGTKKKPVFDPDTTTRTFSDIKFFPNDATIVESWNTLLDELSDYLKENDRKGVLVTGHSDNQGTEAYVVGLSRQRAVEVKKALVARGIDASRIDVEYKGAEQPVGDNSTYEGRVQNNRVSIKIQ